MSLRPVFAYAAPIDPLRFCVFRRRDEPVLAAQFQREVAACYARYGAQAAVNELVDDDVSFLTVTRDGRLVAGIRIHTRTAMRRLPLEAHFGGNAIVAREIEWRAQHGLAELTGLWSSSDVAGTGIGGLIVGAAAAVGPSLGLEHMVSFAHQFNRFTRSVGFAPDLSIGEHPYPDARYRSTVNWCETVALPTADPVVRARILALRAAIAVAPRGAALPLEGTP